MAAPFTRIYERDGLEPGAPPNMKPKDPSKPFSRAGRRATALRKKADECPDRWEGGPHRWEPGAPGEPDWCYYCEALRTPEGGA